MELQRWVRLSGVRQANGRPQTAQPADGRSDYFFILGMAAIGSGKATARHDVLRVSTRRHVSRFDAAGQRDGLRWRAFQRRRWATVLGEQGEQVGVIDESDAWAERGRVGAFVFLKQSQAFCTDLPY